MKLIRKKCNDDKEFYISGKYGKLYLTYSEGDKVLKSVFSGLKDAFGVDTTKPHWNASYIQNNKAITSATGISKEQAIFNTNKQYEKLKK